MSNRFLCVPYRLLISAILLRLAPRAICYILYFYTSWNSFHEEVDMFMFKLTIVLNSFSDAIVSSALYHLDNERILLQNHSLYLILTLIILNHIGVIIFLNENLLNDIIIDNPTSILGNFLIVPILIYYLFLAYKWTNIVFNKFTILLNDFYSISRILIISILIGTLLVSSSANFLVRTFLLFVGRSCELDVHINSYFAKQMADMFDFGCLSYFLVIYPTSFSINHDSEQEVMDVEVLPIDEDQGYDDDEASIRNLCGHVKCERRRQRQQRRNFAEFCYLDLVISSPHSISLEEEEEDHENTEQGYVTW